MATLRQKLEEYVVHDVEGLADKNKKDEGVGSYGTVYRVTVEGIPRVAKQLHELFLKPDVSATDRESVLQSFYKECLLLSELSHPNIVNFVGVHFGQKDSEVSLIMERMYIDLDKFNTKKSVLQDSSIPFSIKASILLDVSYGLLYLHSLKPKPIIHRDLTLKNILLSRDLRVKIADLGVAKLLNASQAHTKCPGAQHYMPPEALRENPTYGAELDIFSFGHLALCVGVEKDIQVFDFPDCDADVVAQHCKLREQQVLKRITWINLLEKRCDSGFCSLIKDCLKDVPSKRPSTKQVSRTMKIQSDKYPKKPVEMVLMWNESETDEEACDILSKLPAFQELHNQLDETSSAKKQFEEECVTLKNIHTAIANEISQVTQDLTDTEKQLQESQQKLQDCQRNLQKEQEACDLNVAIKTENEDTMTRTMNDLASKLAKITNERDKLKDLLPEHGLTLDSASSKAGKEEKANKSGKLPLEKKSPFRKKSHSWSEKNAESKEKKHACRLS